MIPLSERDWQDFQKAVPWFTGSRLPDGRVLGNQMPKWVKGDDDIVIQSLKRHFTFSPESTLIELGAAEGNLTVHLAPLVKRMVSVEVRPRNIVGLLTRLFVHGVRNVDVWLRDASLVSSDWGKFDVLVHAGLLYHFGNPVAHLFSLKDLADQLLLDTHYGTAAMRLPPCAVEYNGRRYPGYLYREYGWANPYGGVAPASSWLDRDLILELLREIGYSQIEVVYDDSSYSSVWSNCAMDVGYNPTKPICDAVVSSMPRFIVAARR